MSLKIISFIGAGLLILAVAGGLFIKLMAKTEGYRADAQTFHTFEPHFFFGGCANYIIDKEKRLTTANQKKEVNK